MNTPQYMVMLLERQYIANLEAGLRTKLQMLNQAKKANQYDVNANREIPLVKEDLKRLSELLISYNNLVNLKLQEDFGFEFKSIKVVQVGNIDEVKKEVVEKSKYPDPSVFR